MVWVHKNSNVKTPEGVIMKNTCRNIPVRKFETQRTQLELNSSSKIYRQSKGKWRVSLCFFCLLLPIILLISCSKPKPLSDNELLRKAIKAGENGNWREARTFASQLENRAPDNVNALIMLGIAYQRCQQPDLAYEKIAKAANLDADSFTAHFLKGKMLYDSGKYQDCISPLRQALKIRPDDANTLILLAESASQLKLPDATDYYIKLAKKGKFKSQPEPFNELGLMFAEKGEKKKAVKCLLKAKNLDKENPIVILNLAVFCDTKLKNSKAAVKYYREYLELTKNHPELDKKRKIITTRVNELTKN